MNKKRFLASTALVGSLLLYPAMAQAQTTGDTSNAALLQRIEQMEQDLNALKTMLKQANIKADTANQTAEAAIVKAETATKEAKTAKQEAVKIAKASNGIGNSDMKWHIAGYADAGLMISDGTSEDTFTSGRFNPMFHFQYKDLVLFESELQITTDSEGETEVEVEYSQFDIFLHDNATLVAGKFLSPVGQFQERLHPSWINKLPDAPAGFGHDGVQPANDIGVQLRGGIPVGDNGGMVTYALAVGNGPRMGHGGGIELEAAGTDDNSNKSVSGRVGFLPISNVEFGGSFLVATVDGIDGPMGGPPTDADFTLWGFDAAFTQGPWDARVEYLKAERDSLFSAHEPGDDVEFLSMLELEAWYAQVAYRLSGVTEHPVLRNMEPVVRYGEYDITGSAELRDENAEKRINVGLNYWLAPSIVVKGGLEWRDFAAPGMGTEMLYQFQVAYGF